MLNRTPMKTGIFVKWSVTSFVPGEHLEYCGEVIFAYRSWGETWFTVAKEFGRFADVKASEVQHIKNSERRP